VQDGRGGRKKAAVQQSRKKKIKLGLNGKRGGKMLREKQLTEQEKGKEIKAGRNV